VLAWFVLLLTLATLASVLLLREVLINRLDHNVEYGLRREAEQLRRLASGPDPETGEPFGRDVEQLFRAFLRSKVPSSGEAFSTLVDGRPFLSTAAPYDLATDRDLAARWSSSSEADRAGIESPAGPVEYLAVPVVSADGDHRATFVVARFVRAERADVDATVEVAGAIIGLLLLLATGLAWAATGRALGPVRLLTETARTLSDTDLSRRIPPQGSDEIGELTRTFNAMLDRLEHAFGSQREFLQDAGHELRTPITIVRGHLELMGDDPQQRRETLALVLDELERMSRLVDDLLLLARAQRRDFLRVDDVDVAQLTQEATDKAVALAPRAWRVDGIADGVARADRQRLTQALVQLASNAVHHTATGDEIGLGSRADGRVLSLWVRDTGRGVPAAEAEHIFERFARGRSARRRSDGAGLGLPIVRAIAEAHGGHVTLDSPTGEGATFTLVLPVLGRPG